MTKCFADGISRRSVRGRAGNDADRRQKLEQFTRGVIFEVPQSEQVRQLQELVRKSGPAIFLSQRSNHHSLNARQQQQAHEWNRNRARGPSQKTMAQNRRHDFSGVKFLEPRELIFDELQRLSLRRLPPGRLHRLN